jgi:hypothetical protein
MITGIVIPHDAASPITEEPFDGLADYQKAVGGYVELVHISEPKLTIYANEEGKVYGLPINRRATCMWWLLAPESRGLDLLVGNVVVIGAQRGPNSSTEVSPDFRGLLLETTIYKVELRTVQSKTRWFSNEIHFNTYFEAAIYAIDLMERWSAVRDIRVIPA